MTNAIARVWLGLSLFVACTPATEDSAALGTWVVTGHAMPGISAMSTEEADAWLGKVATYTASRASFAGEFCELPRYESSVVQAEVFLTDFRVPPESLGLGQETIDLVRVHCRDSEWVAPGAVLFMLDDSRALTVWDGVFFSLQNRTSGEVP